ncbi:NAD(P)H-dependent oxidoreductase [Metamycoplasma gateae]|uniref:NAD(P)H-dependent oxidoreductase n=1 Tax=Metamycoplasma gateae TaxID=35769 RepID=A0ABZ2ALG5_9BACT|nr:NAD(P)H-dependent oxidoreductase [Metamycoplasma gateae]
MNVYLIMAHPTKESFNNSLAEAYEAKLKTLGKNVKKINLIDLELNPILIKNNQDEKQLNIIKEEQEKIKWADEIVFFYPLWWGSIPALLKGYIDNVFQSGFAFSYRKDGSGWDKLLKNKIVRVFSTCDAPSWFITTIYKNTDFRMIKTAISWFTGMKLKQAKRIDKLYKHNKEEREQIIKKIISKIK